MSTKKQSPWCGYSILKTPIYLGLALNKEQYYEILKKLKVDSSDESKRFDKPSSMGFTQVLTSKGGVCCVVCLTNSKEEDVISTLVHESYHVYEEIMSFIGEKTPSSEFSAYTIQSVFDTLYSKYKELCSEQSKQV